MTTTASPTASPPLSRIRRAGGLVFVSGELPFAPDGSVPDGIAAQTELCLRRIRATLDTAGLTLNDIVQVTAYLTNPSDFGAFNTVYRDFFDEPFPTRTTVVAQLVVPGPRIELTVVAAASSDD